MKDFSIEFVFMLGKKGKWKHKVKSKHEMAFPILY